MEEKSTHDLFEILQGTDEKALMQNLQQWDVPEDIPLSELLQKFLKEQGLTKSYVVEQSGVHRTYAYQIFQGARKPGRDKLLALCLAMRLGYERTQQALNAAGVGVLYARNQRDAIVIYALQNNLSVLDANTVLYEAGQEPLE